MCQQLVAILGRLGVLSRASIEVRRAHYHSVKNVQVLGCKRLSLIQENAENSRCVFNTAVPMGHKYVITSLLEIVGK